MATIKITKGMDFTDLINHIKETNYKFNEYISTDEGAKVVVGSLGSIKFDSDTRIYPENIFLVDIEEEVTEETAIDNLVEHYIDSAGDLRFAHHTNVTIKQRLADFNYKPQSFYSLNDDLTMTLVWKDGKLVD